MQKYSGKCHCGDISFSFNHDVIDRGLRCNCSICKRKGAVMSEFTIAPDAFEFVVKNDALVLYQFDSKTAKHYFCKVCGIYPFHETRVQPGYFRVNLACIDEIDTEKLKVTVFEGKNI